MNNISSSSHKNSEPESSVLYIVGTPIGNLFDLSYRAINILENVSFIACEDTRQTKKIMSKLELKNNLISFNQHNSYKKISNIINDLKSGKSVALVSDSGMPGICDPGEDLIENATLNKIKVICVPGPSAVITALVSSGLPSSKFVFEGFLPRKKSERAKLFSEISESKKTSIFFESPKRLKDSLNELKQYCGGDRDITVSRELTKKFEENIRDKIDNVIDYFASKEVLGEITIVVKGKDKSEGTDQFDKFKIKKELNELINAGLSLPAASKYLAKKNNIAKSLIYKIY